LTVGQPAALFRHPGWQVIQITLAERGSGQQPQRAENAHSIAARLAKTNGSEEIKRIIFDEQ
jgi:hypothetical protein